MKYTYQSIHIHKNITFIMLYLVYSDFGHLHVKIIAFQPVIKFEMKYHVQHSNNWHLLPRRLCPLRYFDDYEKFATVFYLVVLDCILISCNYIFSCTTTNILPGNFI